VRLENVTKVYPGNVKAVNGIDLEIADAEFLVLVGPSGCGKSTTLRMVAGLEEITDGRILIDDRVVNDVPPKDRDIAMVFQNYALYPHMTVSKNMAFALKLRRFSRQEIDSRVQRAAKMLGITAYLQRKPKTLSGGQRQRVALGRAIVRDPACFLFDEPLSNLDAKLRVETRAELKRLHRELRTTTIYVTHDQEEALTLGDRVVVMSDGLIQQVDTPLNVYNHPVNRFVAGFVGNPPMNFLEGKLVHDDGQVVFQGGGISLVIDGDQGAAAAEGAGKEVVLGIRPDGLLHRPSDHANGEDRATQVVIQVVVQVVEPLGSTMDLYCTTTTGERLIARVKSAAIEEESTITLSADPDQLHLFEPGEYGVNITRR